MTDRTGATEDRDAGTGPEDGGRRPAGSAPDAGPGFAGFTPECPMPVVDFTIEPTTDDDADTDTESGPLAADLY